MGGPTTQQSMVIINDNVRSRVKKIYTWRFTPTRAGKFTIPATSVKASGKVYRSRPIDINVLAPTESDLFSIRVETDRKRIYPMQRFTVDVVVELKRLPEEFSHISPVSSRVLRASPRLDIPWFLDSRIPTGIEALGPLDYRPWRTRDGSGFGINGLGSFAVATFLPDAEPVEDEDGEGTGRLRYRFRRPFVATRGGEFELGRVSLQGQLVESITDQRPKWESVFGTSEPVVVNIQPLPLDSRPDSWIGVIGDLDVRSEITPKTARVGEPVTLTLKLNGTGTLADAFPPDLAKDETIAEYFRVYEPTSKLVDRARVFTYSLRATKAGTIEFPSIALSWFDPAREEYVTGRTSPISVAVAEGQSLDGDQIVTGLAAATATPGQPPSLLQQNEEGILANASTLTNDGLRPSNWFIVWGGIAGITALLCLTTGRKASLAAKAKARKKQQLASASNELKAAFEKLGAGDRDGGISGVRLAVNRIVSAAVGSPDEGLTTQEVTARLSSAGFDVGLVDQTRDLLEACDAARYGAAGDAIRTLRSQAESTIADLLKAARRVAA